ncbi:MAG: hypothetical protein R3320_05280, partial [Nitriliruptorales bacterium]|nr:hypothetical protein [Nitriliruptorales bacterium]
GELTELRHPEAVEVWHGVVWSRLGRGDLAWDWWDQVEAAELAPWVAAERGRTLRELGLHREAEVHDLAGLEDAVDIVDVVMLRLSLVADALGRGDLDTARLRFDAVEPMLDELPDGPRLTRQRMRRAWIAVELGLHDAYDPPFDELPRWDPEQGVVFPDDYAHGSTFHAAKGLLFAGIARDDGRLLDAAADIAPPILRWAIELARADRSRDGALAQARDAWNKIVPPPGFEDAVAGTDVARRLRGDQPRSEGSSRRAPSSS